MFKIVHGIRAKLVSNWEQDMSVPAKWISRWRGHVTLKSIVGDHGWPPRQIFYF